MAGFGDIVQKAFYLGVGVASYAGEKAGGTLKELRDQTQTLVNEMVERGELTADEAQQLLNKMMQRVQESPTQPSKPPSPPAENGPRRIEILDDEESTAATREAEALRRQVEMTRQQLEDLKRKTDQ
jgi:polyhydroxyalkanoate synthesis regulator phasin